MSFILTEKQLIALQHRLRSSGQAEGFRKSVRTWGHEAPVAAEALLQQVRNDVCGRFILPGSHGLPIDSGRPPRWHENPTTNEDKEWIWTLNRQEHWTRMLRAEALLGDQTLSAQVVEEWLDWIRCCPLPTWEDNRPSIDRAFNAVTPWRTLEVGLRAEGSWGDALVALSDSPVLTLEALGAIVTSFHEHGRVLDTMPKIFWPRADHNHYLTEMAGLLRIGVLLPELPCAEEWRTRAWAELERCINSQITPDGGQIEGCSHYHCVCMKTLARITRMGRRCGLNWSRPSGERLEKMLDYILQSCRPNGMNVPWGDSDTSVRVPLQAMMDLSMALDLTRHLCVIQRLVDPSDWSEALAESIRHAEEPESWLRRMAALPVVDSPPRSHRQHQLHQVMLRTDWTRDAASLFFACRTPVNNGHAHIDPAGFDFYAYGRPLAVDPGRFTYHEGPERYAFKSAAWHNTVTIDQRDPIPYASSFSFGPQHPGVMTSSSHGNGWQAAACEQHNFTPVYHRRLVLLLDTPAALVVVDFFDHLAPEQTVQLWFHLDSTAVVLDPSATAAETRDEHLSNLRVEGDPRLRAGIHPGRISEQYDQSRPSTRLCLADSGGESTRCYVTRLLPRKASSTAWPVIEASSDGHVVKARSGAWHCSLPWPEPLL